MWIERKCIKKIKVPDSKRKLIPFKLEEKEILFLFTFVCDFNYSGAQKENNM